MQVARTLEQLRSSLVAWPRRHLVPTMGSLHAGHLALVAAARGDAGVVASIFVNPTQFGQAEDLARYPRDEAGDLDKLAHAGCDLVWLPDIATMYPPGDATSVDVAGPAEGFEGRARPGHFRGVATVVAKLFGQVAPARAYFGEKDWQQLQVVRRMTADLSLPVEVRGVPTVREPDGLAMSSRNRFLTGPERALAPRLHAELAAVARTLRDGGEAAPHLTGAEARLARAGFGVDYLALVDAATLAPVHHAAPATRILAAARLGSVRLLDNVDGWCADFR